LEELKIKGFLGGLGGGRHGIGGVVEEVVGSVQGCVDLVVGMNGGCVVLLH